MSLPTLSFPTWIDSAACTDAHPETFFPGIGDPAHAAKAICKGCDVSLKCLTYCLDYEAAHPGSRHGVFGGTTPDERRLLVRGGVMSEDNAAKDALADWPPADLPSNVGAERYEYGVLLDRLDQGLGVTLLDTTSDLNRALDLAAKVNGEAHVRRRRVVFSPWSSPIFDNRAGGATS